MSRYSRFCVASLSSAAEFGSKKKRMSLLSSGSPSSEACVAVLDRRDGDLLVRVQALLRERVERASCRRSAPASVGFLMQLAVGEHRGLEDAAERAGRVDRAGEERAILRQVREVHVRKLVARFGFAPAERLRDDADVRGLLIAQTPVAFEDAVHEAAHHVRIRLGEAAVHREHVGDDQQVAIRHQHLGRAVRLLDDFVGARRPADAAVQARLRAAELVLVGVAGDERILVEHQAELARRRAASRGRAARRPARRLPARDSE